MIQKFEILKELVKNSALQHKNQGTVHCKFNYPICFKLNFILIINDLTKNTKIILYQYSPVLFNVEFKAMHFVSIFIIVRYLNFWKIWKFLNHKKSS